MVCANCEADNPPGRSTCTMCREPLAKGAKSAGKITKKNKPFVPKLLSREPESSLYLVTMDPNPQPIKNLWGKVKSIPEPSLHGLDLATLPRSEWARTFIQVSNEGHHHWGLSSKPVKDFEQLIDDGLGIFGFIGLSDCHIELPDIEDQLRTVFELAISGVDHAVEVAFDFFTRPTELLELHAWINFADKPEPPSSNSNRAAYVAPMVTTTFFVTEGFDV
jgi:hypothetical protein